MNSTIIILFYDSASVYNAAVFAAVLYDVCKVLNLDYTHAAQRYLKL